MHLPQADTIKQQFLWWASVNASAVPKRRWLDAGQAAEPAGATTALDAGDSGAVGRITRRPACQVLTVDVGVQAAVAPTLGSSRLATVSGDGRGVPVPKTKKQKSKYGRAA